MYFFQVGKQLLSNVNHYIVHNLNRNTAIQYRAEGKLLICT